MADIPQVLATYDALVGVALGAGLTYWFSALNRRHQEKREDDTRWYEPRFKAYTVVPQLVAEAISLAGTGDLVRYQRFLAELTGAIGAVRLVSSEETMEVANRLFDLLMKEVNLGFS